MPYGFEAPLWLAGLGVLLPILWLYLRARRRPPATVSSLMIWRAIGGPVVPRRKAHLPLLFFVQAALIAAALAALAVPFARRALPPGPPRDAVIVLDVSASMQARENGETRFDLARAAAQDRARELGGPGGRKLTVIAAGQQPQVVGTQLDGARAADLLGTLEPKDTSGNPTAATELAVAQAGPDGSIDVFTDAPPDGLVMSRDARAITTVHRFGSTGDNVAILGVRAHANPFETLGRARVLVTLHNFAPSEREVTVDLTPLATAPDAGGEAAPAAAPATRTVVLAPGATEVVSIDGLSWSGPFAARLSPEDALPLDDVSYGHVPLPNPLHVVLVSDDSALRNAFESLARSLGSVDVRSVSPAKYAPAEARGAITLFDRFVPASPPPGNVAYLAPSRGNPDVTVVGDHPRARLAETRDHALVAGVQNVDTVLGDRVVGLSASPPLKPVLLGRVEGREVPLLLAGELGGRRVVATAFPVRGRDLRSADALPSLIFTINLLRWLSPRAAEAPLLRLSGERLRASFPDVVPISRLEGPDGARDLAPAEEVTLEHAGVYRAFGPDGARDVLVSFVDPVESDIARAGPGETVTVPQRPADPAPAAPIWERVPYVREALLAALVVMLLEWLVVAASGPRARRRNGEGGEVAGAGTGA